MFPATAAVETVRVIRKFNVVWVVSKNVDLDWDVGSEKDKLVGEP
jgi:hypothetical protein